jgi:hypothetical protein
MWKILFKVTSLAAVLLMGVNTSAHGQVIIDHTNCDITRIPASAIINAKDILHIVYGHSSHGQQIIEGMRNLDAFMTANGSPSGTYAVDFTGNATSGVLDFRDNCNYYYYEHPPRPFPNAKDLGALWDNTGNYTAWATDTRNYLNTHPEVNVIIWSWCGQASYNNNDGHIEQYLDSMSHLEIDYPEVKFIYITGHADGTGLSGNLHINNEIIRNYCITNNKILYDFEDIESWDPEGIYYGDKHGTSGCNWDANNSGITEETREDTTGNIPATPLNGDRNWALEWQDSHTLNVAWYQCNIINYHTQHLNDNLKAYAFWWLMTRIAGWDGTEVKKQREEVPQAFILLQNYPNPFNPSTKITYAVPSVGISLMKSLQLKIFDILGREIITLVNERKPAGEYTVEWDGKNSVGQQVGSGVYFYHLKSENGFVKTRKMILLK